MKQFLWSYQKKSDYFNASKEMSRKAHQQGLSSKIFSHVTIYRGKYLFDKGVTMQGFYKPNSLTKIKTSKNVAPFHVSPYKLSP